MIALAGSDAKCAKLRSSLKVDAALNYSSFASRGAPALAEAISAATAGGAVTCVCDLTGGWLLAAAMISCAPHARIAVCGRISAYENEAGQSLIDTSLILTKQLKVFFFFFSMLLIKSSNSCEKIEGFIVPASSFAPAKKELLSLLSSQKLQHWETVVEGGLDATPDAFASLFVQGSEHVGKLIVKLSD